MTEPQERPLVGASSQESGDRKSGEPKNGESGETAKPLGIAEKVRFWEEQDRINEVLIPKVIRQHELLTKHIEEHESLHELFRRELSVAQEKQARYLRACRWLMVVALVCALVSVVSVIGSVTSIAAP